MLSNYIFLLLALHIFMALPQTIFFSLAVYTLMATNNFRHWDPKLDRRNKMAIARRSGHLQNSLASFEIVQSMFFLDNFWPIGWPVVEIIQNMFFLDHLWPLGQHSKVNFRRRFIGVAYRIYRIAEVLQCWCSRFAFLLPCCSMICFSGVSLAFKSCIFADVL